MAAHVEGGHWGHDILVVTLRKRFDWPQLWQDAADIPSTCPWCQQFGPRLRNFLLQPITRLHPFQMFAVNYLKLPTRTGGYKEVLLFVDFMTRYAWGFMTKWAGTSGFSARSLRTIVEGFRAPKLLLSDNGTHFHGQEMDTVCKEFSIGRETLAAYTAHSNGLVENENKLLLSILGKLCAADVPGVGISIGSSWPTQFSKTMAMLNERITPVLGTSPKAVLFGIVDDIDIDDLLRSVPDVGLRFAFLEAEQDCTVETLRHI
jgi:transposase InsO family protein